MTDKYKAACIEYAEARGSIPLLTDHIGACLSACQKEQEGQPEPVDHLKMAYEMTWDIEEPGVPGDRYFVNHDGDPGLYLMDMCTHCHKAHWLIQARKEARQRFGIAKRRIGLLGLAVIKKPALPTED